MDERPGDIQQLSDGGYGASGVTPAQLAWGVPAQPQSYWPARIAVVAAAVLYVLLPERLIPGPRLLVPVLEGVVLLVISVVFPHRTSHEPSTVRRVMAIVLIALVTVANLINLGLLIRELLKGGIQNGRELVFSSIAIWVTNVIVFGLWYWELDRGGPAARHDPAHREPDFFFPQMTTPGAARPGWTPTFVDYLYVSLTNATAFSPTDTMPLTPTAKALMGVQALASLLTVALVAARAVNILS
ncbi:MAG TPA: hypothetical protein VG266_10390 [Candidatus Dormibacteraeota bacterium]|jgi:hypothetical protein|nr:hypothetical protein [Candidatus Dormibacteraeota bacterium]